MSSSRQTPLQPTRLSRSRATWTRSKSLAHTCSWPTLESPVCLHGYGLNICTSSYVHTLLGDTVQFAEYVERNIRLYQIRNNYPLRPPSAASWVRKTIAQSLRSRNAYGVNLLLGGYDTSDFTPHLYWIDHFGTLVELPFAAHGYGSYFALSLLDR